MRSIFKKSDYAASPRGPQRAGFTGRAPATRGPAGSVQITALSERTSGHDESLGALVGDMRLALGLTPGELALRLGTTVDIVMILEQGRLRALPHWEETHRIVTGLCALHRLDPRPLLQRIFEQTSPTHVGAPPERGPSALQRAPERTAPQRTLTERLSGRRPARTAPPEPATRPRALAPAPAPIKRKPVKAEAPAPRKQRSTPRPRTRGRGRALMAVAGPMVLIAAVIWTIQAQPRVLRAGISKLPASVSGPVLGGLDTLAARLAPRHDGLRWIEVADPSSRKADKLPVAAR